MNPSCGIIQDLLPLYAENLCGEESRAAVEEHLAGCESCREKLSELRRQEKEQPSPELPLKNVYLKIRKKQLRLVVLALCLTLFAVTVTAGRARQPHPVPYLPSYEFEFTPLQTGGIVMRYDESLQPIAIEGHGEVTEPGDEASFYVFTLMFEASSEPGQIDDGKDLPFRAIEQSVRSTVLLSSQSDMPVRVYMIGPDGQATLLYADPAPEGAELNGGLYMLPRLALNYYALIMLGLLCLTGAAWLLCLKLKKEKARRILGLAFLIPLSYLLAQLAVKGLSGLSWDLGMDLRYILLAAAFAFGAMAFSLRQWRERRA